MHRTKFSSHYHVYVSNLKLCGATRLFFKNQNIYWKCISVVDHLPYRHEIPTFLPNTIYIAKCHIWYCQVQSLEATTIHRHIKQQKKYDIIFKLWYHIYATLRHPTWCFINYYYFKY